MAKLKDLKVTIGLEKKGLRKLNQDLKTVKHKFRANFGEISNLAKRAGAAIMTGVAAGLTAIVKSGADLQTLKVGFRSIMGSAEGAATMVDKLNKFTASTPFRLQEVATSARQLIAVGVGVDDINDRMRMLGDIAAASGNSIQDIAAAFSKVQAKGKVELENLNQLAERGIPIFAELKKVTGDANMEFGAGKVSVEQYNQALANMATEGGFANGAMENLSETVSGKFSTAMDNITLALGEFAEKSGLLATITNSLDDMTKQVQRMSIGDGDLVKSREEVYDISVRLREAHKGNITALQEEAKAAYDTAFAINQALDTKSSEAHLKGARSMYDRVTEAMAFANTSLSTIPDAPAGFGEKAAPAGPPEKEVKVKKQLFEVEKSRLLQMEMAKELQGTMASDIMAAAEANHVLHGSYEDLGNVVISSGGWMEEWRGMVDGMKVSTMQLAQSIGQQLANAFGQIVTGAKSAKEALKQFAAGAIKAALAASQAMIIEAAIKSGKMSGPAAMLVIPAMIAAGMGIVDAAFGQVAPFADGGLVTGPTLGMVGEGPGTSMSNPEVIAPLDKLQQMMGGGAVTVTGMIRGSDILLSNERSALDRNRVRGF